MYIEEIKIKNLRVFAEASATFQYPGRKCTKDERAVAIPNLNLILGNNGAGKSSLLKAIGLSAIGPLAMKFTPFMLVRKNKKSAARSSAVPAHMAEAELIGQCTWQDHARTKPDTKLTRAEWKTSVIREGDGESVNFSPVQASSVAESLRIRWELVHQNDCPAFLAVGYGSTRRVDTDPSAATPNSKLRSIPLRHQRIQSLFSDGYPLIWLGHWLPVLKSKNPGRFSQVCTLLNEVLPDDIEFTAKTDKSEEYLFSQNGALVPFAALSDGCRAFVGWVADMLYHICFGCPKGVKLVDNCGIVLVDEIDLHLHPEWQKTVLPKLAATFPKLQFIVTTHSPIVVGTLQRENIWVCEPAPDGNGSVLVQKDIGVNGLSADQILLTPYFGLESSRAPEKQERLKVIAAAAERKVPGQAGAFLKSLVTAMEDEATPPPAAPVARAVKPATRRKKK